MSVDKVPEEISFGEWLRQRRRMLDLTQQALADQVGCARITLRQIESGGRKPSKELAQILLSKLGIPEIEHPQWVLFARGLSDFPAKPSNYFASKPLKNLPVSLTSFIGREKEQAEILQLIRKYRLVTLVGSGGVGKTRLSLKIGEQSLEDYVHGVWLVELAPILDPLLAPRTIAIAIGLSDEPQRPVIDMLSDYLHEKKILIILDNCEHILDACAQLVDTLLKNCPHLKILTTSREALGILGEVAYRVPSLGMPDIQPVLEKVGDYESVRLFEERAQLARVDFSLTIENASSVAKICTYLDGIPLAIELAAARVSVLSTEQIAARLQESFNLLTGGSRTGLPQHYTLRAAIDWSYDLLSLAEQTLLQRLSVFVNGWTLEAAESVASDGDIKSEDVLDLLTRLIRKSLVSTEKGQSSTRYQMLETIRQYAYEKLLEGSASEAIRDQHLVYFVQLAERAEPELYRSNQVYWFNCLDDELDNLRTALKWALATNVESGLRILIPWRFWDVRGYFRELGGWLSQLLDKYKKDNALYAYALTVYSYVLAAGANLTKARIIAHQSLELSRMISDKHAEAFSLLGLGLAFALQGDHERGIPIVEESLALYRSLGDRLGQANVTAWLSLNNNDLERSKFFLFESLKLYRELGNLSGIASCLDRLALRAIWGGDFSSPVQWLEEARAIYHQLGSQRGEVNVLEYLGNLAYWQGDYQQALTYYQESMELNEKVGISPSTWPRVHTAYALLRQDEIVKSKGMFRLGIQQFQKANNVIGMAYAIEGLASLLVKQDQFEHAEHLFAWADAVREKFNDLRPPVEQASVEKDLAVIHSTLNDKQFASLSAEGRSMTVEQATAYALELSLDS